MQSCPQRADEAFMPPIKPAMPSSLLQAGAGPTRLPAIAQRSRQPSVAAVPVLRSGHSPLQLSLPFFAPTTTPAPSRGA